MTLAEAREFLSHVGWLSRQPAGFRMRLLAATRLCTVEAGATLRAIGDPPAGIYGLAGGLLDVLIAPGPTLPMAVLLRRPGLWIGDVAVLTGTGHRAGLQARVTSQLLHVPTGALHAMAREDPETWRRIAGITIGHLDEALAMVACLNVRDPRLRLALLLGRLSASAPEGAASLDLPVSQTELGEMAGLSRNTVGKLLADLAAAGAVRKRYGTVALVPSRLREVIEALASDDGEPMQAAPRASSM